MKRSLVAFLVVAFLVLTATPAFAALHGRVCDDYLHPENHTAVKVCISTNQNGSTKKLQGLVEFYDVAGWNHVDCLYVQYVSLREVSPLVTVAVKSGLSGCAYGTGGFDENQEQTNWVNCDENAGNYNSQSQVKIRWATGDSSTWKTDTSGNWNPTAADCIV